MSPKMMKLACPTQFKRMLPTSTQRRVIATDTVVQVTASTVAGFAIARYGDWAAYVPMTWLKEV